MTNFWETCEDTKTNPLFRKAVFDIALEKSVFISGLDTLEEAVASFMHLCFTANIEYPKVPSFCIDPGLYINFYNCEMGLDILELTESNIVSDIY